MTVNTIKLNLKSASVCSDRTDTTDIVNRVHKGGSFILIAAMFIIGTAIALFCRVPVRTVMRNYSYDVLVILIVMELFTNLIVETGIMQFLAVKIADLSSGRLRLCLILFGSMMFLISSCLNNITAVMMVLPVVFVLLETLEIDRKYVSVFFAAILALSNCGGAASPIGDFPAVVIMTSGITSFLSYLTHAFPIFAITSAVLITIWGSMVRRETDDGGIRTLAVSNLRSQYRNNVVRKDVLAVLCIVFAGMFMAWSFVDQKIIPPEIIAVIGYVSAMTICAIKGIRIEQRVDLKSVLTIGSFLFFAQVISQTGVLSILAEMLKANINSPKLLILSIMIITSVVAGVFSAGPAAAAMMPIIVDLCNGTFSGSSDWIAIAYAASICAGSSMFMWSATAGFILSGKVNAAGIEDDEGKSISWGIGEYFKYGIVNYLVQMSIAILTIAVIL